MTKTNEEIVLEIEDNIKSLNRKRDKLIIELDSITKELSLKIDELYRHLDTMVAIKCPECQGKGYLEGKDKAKQFCRICGGPDRPYIWAEKY